MSHHQIYQIIERHLTYPNQSIEPGNYILVNPDFVYTNALTMASALKVISKFDRPGYWDKSKIAIFPDHFTPNKDIKSANIYKTVRDWAHREKIENYFEVGDVGIEHIQMIEKGFVKDGELVIGGDSHSCTLGGLGLLSFGVGTTDLAFAIKTGHFWMQVPKVLNIFFSGEKKRKYISGKDLILYLLNQLKHTELSYKIINFSGEFLLNLPSHEKFTMCNMVVEGGAKSAVFLNQCAKVVKNVQSHTTFESLEKSIEKQHFDLSAIDYQVALPPDPCSASDIQVIIDRKITLDQVFIGSCTNGHLEDLRIAAALLMGKKRHHKTRLIIIPATPEVYKRALSEGLIEIFVNAGAVIGPPTCGPCLGGHMGVLADKEICLSTSNRNFNGRMGSPKSKVYLSSPAVAAASAISGFINRPENIE